MAMRVVGMVLQVGVFVLIARTHTIDDVGIYAFVNAFFVIVRALGALGLDQAALKYISSYVSNDRLPDAALFTYRYGEKILHHITIASVAPLTVGILLVFRNAEYVDYAYPIILMSIALPAYALIGFYVCVMRAHGSVVTAQLPESILLPLFLLCSIGALILLDYSNVASTLAAQAAIAWLVVFSYRRSVKSIYKGVSRGFASEDCCTEVDAMARSTLRAMAATAIAARAPVILLTLTVTAGLVGLFEGALRLALLGTIPVWAVGVVVSPLISRAASAKQSDEIQRLYGHAGLFQALPAFAILGIIILYGDALLVFLFGPQFEYAYEACVIIAIATAVNATGSVAGSYLLMTGGEKVVQKYSMWALVIVLVGVPIGSLTAGLVGAAWVLVFRSFIRDIGLMYYVAKVRGIYPITDISRQPVN